MKRGWSASGAPQATSTATLSIPSCLLEAQQPVLRGGCLPSGAARQLGLRTPNRQHLRSEGRAQRRYFKINNSLRAVPVVRTDLVDRSHGDLTGAEGRTALVRCDHRGLNRRRVADDTAKVLITDSAGQVMLHRHHGFIGREVAVIETVGEDQNVGSEAITSHMAALPDKFRPLSG